jgi:hypothetical protein
MLKEIEFLLECQIITFLYQALYQIAGLEVHSASVYSLAGYIRTFRMYCSPNTYIGSLCLIQQKAMIFLLVLYDQKTIEAWRDSLR